MDKNTPPIIHSISGLVGGSFANFVFHPLDLIKARMQVQHVSISHEGPIYKTSFHAIKHIYKHEGIRAFYQGLVPNVIGNAAAWGTYFFVYNSLKQFMDEGEKTLPKHKVILSAVLSGFLTTIITNPIWLIKVRLETQLKSHHSSYRGMTDAIRTIYREEGFRGYYKGLVAGLIGTSHGVVLIFSYEEFKKIMDRYENKYNKETNFFLKYFSAGALSKLFASVSTYPYQVVKSRMQARSSQYKQFDGIMHIIREIWVKEGIAGFFRGVGPSTIRVLPTASLTFATYEFVCEFLKKEFSQN